MAGTIRHLTPNQFRDACKGKKFLPPAIVVKSYSAEVEAEDKGTSAEPRTLTFTISTGAIDRDGDTVDVGGWDLGEFNKSGVVLWAHNATLPPIARPIETWTTGDTLKSKAQFTPPDMGHPLGDGFGYTVYRMFEEGYLRGVSVGFLPKSWKINEERGGDRPIDFERQSLLEFSAVPIPSNPEALLDAASKGIDTAPIGRWCEMALDDEGTRLVLSRDTLDDVRRMTTGNKVIAQVPDQIEAPVETPEVETKGDDIAEVELYAVEDDGGVYRYESEPATPAVDEPSDTPPPPARMKSEDWDKVIGAGVKEKTAGSIIDEIRDRVEVLEVLTLTEAERLFIADIAATVEEMARPPKNEIEKLLGGIDADELEREIKKRINREIIQPLTGELY